MTFIYILLIMGVSAIAGKILTSNIIARDKFYKEFLSMLEYFKNNINFTKQKIEQLYMGYLSANDVKFKEIFLELKNINLLGSEEQSKSLNKAYFLKKEEKQQIIEFSKMFGTHSDEIELGSIDAFMSQIKQRSCDAESKRKSQESLYYKLCLAVGSVVCILII